MIDKRSDGFQIELGYVLLDNSFNQDGFVDLQETVGYSNLNGYSVRFIKTTNINHLDLVLGSLLVRGDDLNHFIGGIGGSSGYSYIVNGGGVFVGVSPKWKKRNYGLTSEFLIGTFSFKETTSVFNNLNSPFVDIHDVKASHGLGGMAGVGFYVRVGRFGLSPTVNAIYSGGANASFLFYGVTIPLTIRLTD